jgi:hypothetical protein
MEEHGLSHALGKPCEHGMSQITRCVICGRNLDAQRPHIDTCSELCFKRLLALQREEG